MYQLAFCDTIIERNNRCRLPIASQNGARGLVEILEPFFPFDPYLLSRWVNHSQNCLVVPLGTQNTANVMLYN